MVPSAKFWFLYVGGGVRSTPVLIFTSFLDIEGPWPCNIVDCLCGVDLNHGIRENFMPRTLHTYIYMYIYIYLYLYFTR